MPSATDAFLAEMLPRQLAAEEAIHNGDAGPRSETWSHTDPVSLFGAWLPLRTGWADVGEAFKRVAAQFSGSQDYRFEIVAAGASGDLAYTVGFEHNVVSVNGKPTTYTLRATHVYRRENGEWRIVHRHGDRPPDEPEPGETPTGTHSR
ncbi:MULTISPECIES: nuclear transport factor 2 family protein [unclassified Amycolatopsis]|uniref:YybH family protein n=1 Tax=unclassified Amycolatopsis TaxID=2618356 RepID=UPI00287521C3|nr:MULTISPECIES: nuclear transport factor 2 family protein [unclassified Amycolatopsis]MDS0137171.1 nuclear transport factor 2 family protein [Amycolatopsis sp. 505]MDS0143836.1 nuclear transport factor 2 family protein [Amycolatopsis sp. CM201R]